MAKPFRASLLPKPRIFLNRAGAPSASVLSMLMKKPRAHGAMWINSIETKIRREIADNTEIIHFHAAVIDMAPIDY